MVIFSQKSYLSFFIDVIPTIFHIYYLVYFDSDDGCHDLNLSIGQNAIYATEPSNRQVSIKVSIKFHLHKGLLVFYGTLND